MAHAWFRFYNSAVDDPKVQRLPLHLFKFWVNLLCIASQREGKLPDLIDLSFSLRINEKQAQYSLKELLSRGLIDQLDGYLSPHNWNVRQYISDVSTERVKRFRKRHETVSVTPPDTDSEQTQKADTETKEDTPRKRVVASLPSWVPEDAWKGFVEMRGRIRAPLTDRAKTLAIANLEKLRLDGNDPELVLNQSVEKSWRGLFPITPAKANGNGSTKPRSVYEMPIIDSALITLEEKP